MTAWMDLGDLDDVCFDGDDLTRSCDVLKLRWEWPILC